MYEVHGIHLATYPDMNAFRFSIAFLLLSACSGTAGPGIPDAVQETDPTDELSASKGTRKKSAGPKEDEVREESADGGVPGSDAGRLAISSFATTRKELVIGRSSANTSTDVRFVAVLANGAGLEQIAGGTLTDDSGTSYGNFNADKMMPGTFTLALTWSEINAIRPLTFSGGTTRAFTARFFDKDGHAVTSTAHLAFRCDAFADNTDAFAGECINSRVDPKHCGPSFSGCSSNQACREGSCVAVKSRAAYDPGFDNTKSCNTLCSKYGQTCEYAAYDGDSASYLLNCETLFSSLDVDVECHCYK